MIKVDENLFRGPRPKSYADLEALGFTRVVSLQSGAEDKLTDSKLEHEDPEAFGIELVRIRCSNIFPPSPAQIFRALDNMNPWEKTYVHCHSGVDRTGFVVLVYRMLVQEWTWKAAHAEWKRLGRHWWFFWWTPYAWFIGKSIESFRRAAERE